MIFQSLLFGPSIVIFIFVTSSNLKLTNACDDNGAWAELLVSNSSDSPAYLLGGLFSIHAAALELDDDNEDITALKCDCAYQETVFLVEAMIYAIEQINQDPDLLPNVTLGYNILGSCDTASENAYFALEEYSLLELQILNISDPLFNDDIGDHFKETPVVGVVGPCSSDGGTSIASILQSYGIPIISYGATISALTKRSRFPTLFRTTFNDDKQVEALAELCHTFNWTYVAAVGSDDDLGHEGVEAFKRVINPKGMCLSSESYFGDESDESLLYGIIDTLKNRHKDEGANVNVVLLFMEWQYASEFLKQANSQELQNITWLGVDHWASDVGMTYWMSDDYLPAPFTKGTIASQFSSGHISQFSNYMETNLEDRMRANPWLMYFYCDQCNPIHLNITCTVEYAISYPCTTKVKLRDILVRQRRIPDVFSAVYAAANALDSILKQKAASTDSNDHSHFATATQSISAGNRTIDSDFKNHSTTGQEINNRSIDDVTKNRSTCKTLDQQFNGTSISTRQPITDAALSIMEYDQLIQSLASVNFSFRVGSYQSPRISFRPEGDLNDASFDIVNFYQEHPEESQLPSKSEWVGKWTENEAAENKNHTDAGILKLNIPKIRWQTDSGANGPPQSYCHRACEPGERMAMGPSSCCWSCEQCPAMTYSDTYNSMECKQCGPHTHSNPNNTACLDNDIIWIKYSDPIAITCIALCVVGELITLVAAVICCVAKHHATNYDDSGYAMKTVVFVNFALAYAYVMAIFEEPTAEGCTIRMIMWQTLATANLVAKFFMLPQGRRAASRLARRLGLVEPRAGRATITRSRANSGSSTDSRSGSVTSSTSGSFAYRWICELCYAVVMTLAIGIYTILSVIAPPTISLSELVHDEVQATQSMISCAPDAFVTSATFIVLGAVWVVNLITSSRLFRRARRRRCRTAYGSSTLTASGQSISRRSAVEFHANNLLWSGYLTVLVLIAVVPLYATTEDPWSRAVFKIYTPFVLITLLLGVFALPRCWQALRAIYCHRPDDDDVFQPAPFIISTANDLQARKMSTIPEDEATEL